MLDKAAPIFLILGVCTSLMILKDVLRRPAVAPMMKLAWPVTGFFMPFVGWLAWWYFGRQSTGRTILFPHRPGLRRATPAGVFNASALCASGEVTGALLALALLPLFSHLLPGYPHLCHALFSAVLALLGGITVQTLSWHKAGPLSWPRALLNTLKYDLFPLIAWQLGMFLFFELALHFVLHDSPTPGSVPCWFMLQIACCIGFIFAWPANKVQLEKGRKPG